MAFNLGIFVSHPIQYKAPLHRRLNEEDDIEVQVLFGSKRGVEEGNLGFGDESQSWDVPLLEGYEYEFLPNFAFADEGFFSLNNPTLYRHISREWDAIFLHAGYFTLSSIFALVVSNVKGVPVLLHGAGTERHRHWSKKYLKKIYLRMFLTGVDKVLADCTENIEHYRSYGGSDLDIELMPAAVDNKRFRNSRQLLDNSDIEEVRDELDIPEGHKVVLFVGKLIERKRPMDLLTAFETLDHGNLILLFVGDGGERESLETYVDENDVENVRFAGFRNQSELPKFYELGDIFVLPSTYDPSPKVLNEAMNFELPLLVSDAVGSAADLVQDNGKTFEVGDRQALADALEWALESEERLDRMGEASYELVEEWSFETDVEVVRDTLEDVA